MDASDAQGPLSGDDTSGTTWCGLRRVLLTFAALTAAVAWQALIGWRLAPPGGHLTGDSSQYLHLATHLLEGRGYTYDPNFLTRAEDAVRSAWIGKQRPRGLLGISEDRPALRLVGAGERQKDLIPTRLRQPAYPTFLAAIFAVAGYRPVAVFLGQAILMGLACLMASGIARRLWPSLPQARYIALALIVAFVPIQVLSSLVMPDLLLTFLVVASVYLSLLLQDAPRSSHAALVGLTLGMVPLTKPLGFLVSGWLLLVMLWRLRRGQKACTALLVVGFLLPPLLWALRNGIACGAVTPTSSDSPINLWYGTYEPVSVWQVTGYEAPVAEAERLIGDDYDFTPKANRRILAAARRRIAGDPMRFVLQGLTRVVRIGILDYAGGRTVVGQTSIGLYRLTQGIMLLMWVLFTYAVVRPSAARSLLLVVPVVIVPTCMLAMVPGRALAPFQVLLLIGAAGGATALWQRLARGRREPAPGHNHRSKNEEAQ